MKVRWWVLSLLLLGLVLGPTVKNIPGFVIIALDQTTLQFPLWLAAAIGIITMLVVGVIMILGNHFFSAAGKANSWRTTRKWKKARKETIEGILRYSEGNWEISEKKMISAASYGDTKLINYLIAAQASQNLLAYEKRDEYLIKAKKIAPEADLAIGVTQARLQIESEQYEEALASLLLLLELAPQNKYVNKLLLEVNLELKEWRTVLKRLPTIEKLKVFPRDKTLAIQKKSICGIMLGEFDKEQWQKLEFFWKQQPRKIKKDATMFLEYATIMSSFGRGEEIEEPLKKLLKQEPSNIAIKLFANLKSKHPGKQLDFLESLTPEKNLEDEYFEALSKVADKAELWGKSRDYLRKKIEIKDSVKTRAALANTYVHLGETELAKSEREKAVLLLEKDSQ